MRPSVKRTKKGLQNQLIRVRERLRKICVDDEGEFYDESYWSALDRCYFGMYHFGEVLSLLVFEDMCDERIDMKAWFDREMPE